MAASRKRKLIIVRLWLKEGGINNWTTLGRKFTKNGSKRCKRYRQSRWCWSYKLKYVVLTSGKIRSKKKKNIPRLEFIRFGKMKIFEFIWGNENHGSEIMEYEWKAFFSFFFFFLLVCIQKTLSCYFLLLFFHYYYSFKYVKSLHNGLSIRICFFQENVFCEAGPKIFVKFV